MPTDEGLLRREEGAVRAVPGRLSAIAFSCVNRFCMGFLYGRAGRLTAENGGFRPGQVVKRPASCPGRAEMQLMVGVATYNRPQCVAFARRVCTPRAVPVPSGF